VTRERRRLLASLGIVTFFIGLATLLQLLREAEISAWDTIWAEDGSIFLADGLNDSLVGKVVEPYGGYVHVLPRIVGAIVAALPLENAAFSFALASFVTVSLVSTFVFFASAQLIESVALRLTLSVLVLLLPAAGSELLGNITNIHFFLLYGCFWALLWRSESNAALASRGAVTAAATLGDPLAAAYLPLALWSAVKRRTRRALVVPVIFTCGLAVQAAAMLATGSGPQRGTRFDAGDIPTLLSLRVAGSLLVGDRFIDDLWFRFGRWFSYIALAIVVSLLAVAVVRVDRRRKAFVVLCASYAVFLFCFYLWGRGSAGMRPGSSAATWHLAGARFTLTPILLLMTALLVLADGEAKESLGRWVRRFAVVFVAILVAANFSLKSERSLGPRWKPKLAEARSQCKRDPAPVRILVAPAPFGFFVSTTCERIR
jgi:hypothetical protein